MSIAKARLEGFECPELHNLPPHEVDQFAYLCYQLLFIVEILWESDFSLAVDSKLDQPPSVYR